MTRRQSIPRRLLIVKGGIDQCDWLALRRLPFGSGVLLLEPPRPGPGLRRIRKLARLRGLAVVTEGPRVAGRVHDLGELRQALLQRTPIILVSPMFATQSHPTWRPLPRMRAAAFARLGRRRLLALGGMSEKRYADLARLGFIGWAGISAFRT